MRFLFDTQAFSFEALRVAGYACCGGADLGEVLIAARDVREGDTRSWHRAWKRPAERLERAGRAALEAGNVVSARETLLRASAYYRTADFFLRDDPAHDPEVAFLSVRVRETFATAASLLTPSAQAVSIPFEGVELPAYLYAPDEAAGGPRPTIIYHGGYDSVLEEAYFAIAAAAIRRGFVCLTFDGPGQGAVLRDLGLPFRPDWESVVAAVIDAAVGLPQVDRARLILVGTSMGGYLAARAAAYEQRLAALVTHDAVYDLHAAGTRGLPRAIVTAAQEGRDADVDDAVGGLDVGQQWFLNNGRWAFGVPTIAEFIRTTAAYTMKGIAANIRSPTLLLEAKGAGEHCHEGAMLTFHRVMFDWLTENPERLDEK